MPSELKGTPLLQLLHGEAAEASGENAENAFVLEYRDEGVYLTLLLVTPPTEAAQRALVEHLTRKRLYAADMSLLTGNLFLRSGKLMRLAPAQEEKHYEESYSISIENNQMSAYITLLPPEPGMPYRLDFESVLAEARAQYHINFGLDETRLREAIEKRRYGEKILFAEGRLPVTGRDGELIYHFEKRNKRSEYRLRPNEDKEDARVDFKDLDLFEAVERDQLLVTKVPPEPGEDGYTVFGNIIPAEAGKLYNLPLGKNTYVSEDKLKLHAALSGRVYMERDKVEVSHVFNIEGNVGVSTGNIDFDGDVLINGNVESGYRIKATGNIEVTGTIEAAELESGADIIAYSGVQGAGQGSLVAHGSVYARFMEYVKVHAETMVVAESVLNCEVDCNGFVEVLNGRGNIIGGKVAAISYIAARTLGSQAGRRTQLEVGVSTAMKERVKELEETVNKLSELVRSLQNIIAKPINANQPAEVQKGRMDTVRKLLTAKEGKKRAEMDLEQHKRILERTGAGQIHVLMIAYQGANLTIGDKHYAIKEEISYATFRVQNEEISFTSCRFRKKPEKMPRMRR